MSHENYVRLFVGDVDEKVSEAMLTEAFDNNPVTIRRDRDSKTSLGYAHVTVNSEEKAQDLILSMNGQILGGKAVRVSKYNSDTSRRRSNIGNIVIRNLPKDVTAGQLLANFEQSHIASSKIMPVRGKCVVTMAYIMFENDELAKRAIKQFEKEEMTIGGEKHRVIVEAYIPKSLRESELKWSIVYANDFPVSSSEDDIKAIFSKFGSLESFLLRECKRGRYVMCKFVEHDDAVKCIEELKGKTDTVDSVTYTWFVTKSEKGSLRKKRMSDEYRTKVRALNKEQSGRNLYVYRIKESATLDEFKGWFSGAGEIESIRLPMADDDKCAGFGYVCFKTKAQAEEAIKMYNQNSEVNNNVPLFVTIFKSREERQSAKAVMEMSMKSSPQYMAPNYYPNMGYVSQSYLQGIPHEARPHMGHQHPNRNGMHQMAHEHHRQQNTHQHRPVPVPVPVEVPRQAPAPVVVEAPRPAASVDSNIMTAEQRQALGGELFNKIKLFVDDSKVGKLTGMLLGLSKTEIMELLGSDSKLKDKVKEAEDVLNRGPA